jgi:ribonucleoside-diphosphate reductase alpha chain
VKLSDNAMAIYRKLYFSEKERESRPTQVHRRVARFVASVEKEEEQGRWEKNFFRLMEDGFMRPNSPMLMNAGIVERPVISACFVGAMEDDLISILDFDKEAAIVYSHGAGIGINYGNLRETEAPLSHGGSSSGPFSFMRKLAATAEAVKSGGRSRRAAHMAIMYDNHPDVLDFINIKRDGGDGLRSMNLSVAASDAFMEAVERDDAWDLIGVVDRQVKKTVRAREVFKIIVTNAHRTGDPGVWFIDRSNEDNTLRKYARIVSTNPCGEEPLLPRQSCNLASINLAAFVKDRKFDYPLFQEAVETTVRFLDNAIDAGGFPTPEYEKVAQDTRPIGTGLMGFADALALMGMAYDSDEAIAFGRDVARFMTSRAVYASAKIASEKGVFPLYEANASDVLAVARRFFDLENSEEESYWASVVKRGLRNSQWTTIAPTGTISLSCDCSQGMEPFFAVCYDKHLADTTETLTIVNQVFEQHYSAEPWYESAIRAVAKNHGSCQGLREVPKEIQPLFKCAHDIKWEKRIAMQAALQFGISSAISSTINLPKEAPPEAIYQIYMAAWRSRLKGVTVYRDGSRTDQPVSFGQAEKKKADKRPKVRYGCTHEVNTGHGKVYLTINKDKDGNVLEVFTNGGKNGSVNSANLEAMARLVSIALQEGVPIKKLANTIANINDGTTMWERLDEDDEKPVCITSIPDALAKTLLRFYVVDGKGNGGNTPAWEAEHTRRCPDCGAFMYMKEGCEFCPSCGSKCS